GVRKHRTPLFFVAAGKGAAAFESLNLWFGSLNQSVDCVCECRSAHEIILMSFIGTLDNLALKKSELVERFEHLIAPKADEEVEAMAQTSHSLTPQNVARTMRRVAPRYRPNA